MEQPGMFSGFQNLVSAIQNGVTALNRLVTVMGGTTTTSYYALNGTATTAGGSSLPIIAGGTAQVGLYFGSGAPTISAAKGSLYMRTDGSSSSTRVYVNSNGSTTWVSVTTAS